MHIVSKQPSEIAPPRMAPLAVLPVFIDLNGKTALVAGGTEAAAWKAELLAAAGAEVHLYAPRAKLCEGMLRLAAEAEGRFVHHGRQWCPADLNGRSVAVADASDDDEARRFTADAAWAGVPCNVIDRPAYCSFQFGSIVNRSPIVLGISTSGAAPILGQAVRRRVETLLPPWLASWAGLARKLRPLALAQLSPGSPRRAFWEAFADRAFAAAPTAQTAGEITGRMDEIAAERHQEAGHVTFVGAGPGDAELLTIKAARALQAADVILFDDLVSDEVLELARREAKRILVGKRAGRPSCRQTEISGMMVRLAKAGRRVVRLKSGDPMIFGRSGEEIAMLRSHGIAFHVVPGITAGIAMASALGMSLTHREHAQSVRFVTGHSKDGGVPEGMDWRGLADPSATTIFYMGGRTAGEIAARLIENGLAADTPAAVAAELGRPDQRTRLTDLAGLPATIETVGLRGPVLIGVGRAFRDAGDAELPAVSQPETAHQRRCTSRAPL